MVATDGAAPVCVSPPGHPPASSCTQPGSWDGCLQTQIEEGSGKGLPVPHPDHIQDGWAADAVKPGTSGAIWVMAGNQ